MKFKRYWSVIFPENRFGPRNLGVTACSIPEARQLLIDEMHHLKLESIIVNLDNAEIIEDVDIRLLDQEHVIPNIGVVTFKGVWFPNPGLR